MGRRSWKSRPDDGPGANWRDNGASARSTGNKSRLGDDDRTCDTLLEIRCSQPSVSLHGASVTRGRAGVILHFGDGWDQCCASWVRRGRGPAGNRTTSRHAHISSANGVLLAAGSSDVGKFDYSSMRV